MHPPAGPPPLQEAAGTPGPCDVETSRRGQPPASTRREALNHLGIVSSGDPTAPMRRLADGSDHLAH
eukprot:14408363-Alexandrium_andersonii.AAC.1